jgi:folate-binding protein YgfZ
MPKFITTKDYLEQVSVTGEDAYRLLQGQLTCDISDIPEQGFVIGSALNNKGRVIAPFMLCQTYAQSYLLLFRQGLAAIFMEHLQKYIPFYRCQMRSDTSRLAWAGTGSGIRRELTKMGVSCAGEFTRQVQETQQFFDLSNAVPQHVIIEVLGDAPSLYEQLLSQEQTVVSNQHWQVACLQNGYFPFTSEDSGKYTPQELAYDTNGFVSFNKGCYTGQEIVARMHYRGKHKHQLILFQIACDDSVSPDNLEIKMFSKNSPEGMILPILKACFLPELGCVALANVPILETQQASYNSNEGEILSSQIFRKRRDD